MPATTKTINSKVAKKRIRNKIFIVRISIGLISILILAVVVFSWDRIVRYPFISAQQNLPGVFEAETIQSRTGNIQEINENNNRFLRMALVNSNNSSPTPASTQSSEKIINIDLSKSDALSTGNAAFQIVPIGGQIISGQGWVATSPTSRLKIILSQGFKGNDGGAVELDVTNLDYSALSSDKHNIMTLYSWDHNGDGANDNFKYIRSLWTFRLGQNYTSDSYGHFALKGKAGTSEVYWENKATVPGGTWQSSRLYTIRMEWSSGSRTSLPNDSNGIEVGDPETEVRLLINGQRVYTTQRMDFGGRSMRPEHVLKYLYIGDDMDRPDSAYTTPYNPQKLIRFKSVRVFYN